MRRASLIVLALAGCMRIYPDPELPDIELKWEEYDCREGTADVAVSVIGLDENSREDQRVACTTLKMSFADVSRQRYRIDGLLYDDAGEVYSNAQTEADMRNGINEHSYLYFGGFSNFRVGWKFDMGSTCDTLGATDIWIFFSDAGGVSFANQVPCILQTYFGFGSDGMFDVRLRAYTSSNIAVAASEEIPDVTIMYPDFTDLGTVTLTPCTSCP